MATKPVKNGRITSGFGYRVIKLLGKIVRQFHPGIDIGSDQKDALIQCAYSGVVYKSGFSKSFGNRIWIRNDIGDYSVYAHLKLINDRIKEGSRVEEGEILGIMGNTGMSLATHLHFEIREKPVLGAVSYEPTEIINLYANENK